MNQRAIGSRSREIFDLVFLQDRPQTGIAVRFE